MKHFISRANQKVGIYGNLSSWGPDMSHVPQDMIQGFRLLYFTK